MDGRRARFVRRPSTIGHGDDDARGYIQTEELVDEGWRIFQWVTLKQPLQPDTDASEAL